MEVVNKKLVLVVIMIGIVSSIFIWQNISDNKTKLEIVLLNQEIKSSNMFAIMLEQIDEEGNSTYVESEDNTWPTDDTYVYDITKSGCMDANGNKIENSLEYDLVNNIASVKTEKTSYCYLYFSRPINLYELCEGTENMSDCLTQKEVLMYMVDKISDNITGGMYRFQGTHEDVKNNYLCFGVSSLEECLGTEYEEGIYDETRFSNYLYRIIGVTPDGNLKLIKREALEIAEQWNAVTAEYVSWPESDLFKKINGNSFLTNLTYNYVPDNWINKIIDYNWKYGYIQASASTMMSYSNDYVYELEYNWGNPTKENFDSNYEGISQGAKIGLMYIHDYKYAGYWILLGNNDNQNIPSIPYYPSTIPSLSDTEWTMSSYGYMNGYGYGAWRVGLTESTVYSNLVDRNRYVRPVFYLTGDIKIVSGDGTATSPFIIE